MDIKQHTHKEEIRREITKYLRENENKTQYSKTNGVQEKKSSGKIV